MKRYCLTLDLINDEQLIEEYKTHHKAVWPEIKSSIRDSCVQNMEIYLLGNRLFMIMEVNDDFSFEAKQKADEENLKVQEWETLMWKYQQALPGAKPGEKWILMEEIFKL
ncbi:L-rhamnose mutarotase [Pedobacter aquatilis]|uniref:L-rhamnose mutarotase n=1 Tax=Pedobacter aquatilis TaxID=351343 RepID=UPI00292FE44B|nr:L-rhamnose mutarotase [Pedobacter aquatilis]